MARQINLARDRNPPSAYSGGTYRLTPTQQVDFHIALGLNHNAPSYIVGVGYSFRIDGLFAQAQR
jgi:hypothetical protein